MYLSVADEVWQKKVKVWAIIVGKTMRQALDEEWPQLMKKVIQFTPPFKTAGQPGSSDLSVGRAAVRNDIEFTMRPFDPQAIRTPGLRRVVEERDYAGYNVIASRSRDPRMAGSRAAPFDPAFHLSQRDGRGRVHPRGRPLVMIGSDAKLLKRYVVAVQDRVGWARSGWAAAYNLVKDPDGWQLPNYVAKQGTSGGAVIDDRDAEDPSITAINRTPWASRKDEGERIEADARASRIVAINSKVSTFLRLSAKDAGFNTRNN